MLRTLGDLGLYRHGQDSPVVPTGKHVAVIVYLSTLPGHRANREQLLNLLWSDLEPASARHALRQATWYLRQQLGDDAIEVTNEHLTLRASLESDRDSFVGAVEAGRLSEALSIYRGDFLDGFAVPGGVAFEHWADAERRRLQLLFRHAAESLARAAIECGQPRAARELARRVRDADPLDESAWRLLLETCLAQDDRVSALTEAQRLLELLAAEARTPEPTTLALLRRVNAQPEEAGRQESTALVAELVGREREFAALTAAFRGVERDSACIISLTAAAGLGKTRLLTDLARRLAASGVSAIYVRAQPGDRDMPASYIAEVARQLASRPGARGVSPASAGSLVALDPSISGQFPALPDQATGDEARRRRAAAVAELIESVAEEHPFSLLLDDLHWADAYSRDVLDHALRRARFARMLCVLAARPGGALSVEVSEEIQLAPLTSRQTEALVSNLGSLPGDTWAADFARRLQAAAEGSPLLVLETLQLALETGVLQRENGNWLCPDEIALDRLLRAGSALGRRIGQLDRSEGWLLLLLAVAGTKLDTNVMAAAAGADQERAGRDADELERRGLIARYDGQWSVAHDEIAERAIANADQRQLSAAHAALGRSLLAMSTDGSNLRPAAQHLAAASLFDELTRAATAWIVQARANGDGRPTRVLLAELLGAALNEDVARQTAARLPWTLRVTAAMRWGLAGTGAAAAAVALITAFVAGGSREAGVNLAVWSPESGGRWRMKTYELTERDIARGTVALASFKPTDLVSPTRPEGLIRPGSPHIVAATSAFPDSGGLDVVLTSAGGGRLTRITDRPGDDYARAWSPDGQYLAIATDRWAEHSRSDIAILNPDRPDSPPVRLTSNPTARDELPLWSPDGTRIAFVRGGYGNRGPGVCLVSVDGEGEQCLQAGPGYATGLAGWISPVELAAVLIDSAGASQLVAINTVTGAQRHLARGAFVGYTFAPGWIACFCRRNEAEPFQSLVVPVAQPDRAVRLHPSDPPTELTLFPSHAPRSYLERLRIDAAERLVPLDGSHRLALKGWDAAGAPMEPLATRWTTSDTSVAIIDSTGTLRPRRPGRVYVTATAGGWRTTTVPVTVGPAEVSTVAEEDWRDGLGARWVPFGQPRPTVISTDRGPALAPNGDSTNVSGVYLLRRVPTSGGIGLELDFSTPFTSVVWQNLRALLIAADPQDVSSWDHGAGILSLAGEVWRTCGTYYPSVESELGRRHLLLGAGVQRLVPVPLSTTTGGWTRIRLQFFQDGRCGVAVEGQPRAIIDRPVPLGDSALVMIFGYSHRARVVGRVEVWTGVRRDMDWDAIR
jgi:DNA-binding SARP family transcriptional activator